MNQPRAGGGPGFPEIDPPRTQRERRRRLFLGRRALLLYTAVIAVVAAGMVLPHVLASPPRAACHGGLVPAKASGGVYCVGLTDGSQIFSRPLTRIEGMIYGENRVVERSDVPWVGVAYLVPMSLDQASSETLQGVIDDLSGAYAAQWEANHGTTMGDSPQIKLYLVNEGPQEHQWQVAVSQILAGINNGRRVVAVAGLGQSLQQTYSAAKRLAARNMAMFGATITADGLNGHLFPSLVRVAPTNTNEVEAAIKFLSTLPAAARSPAMLVQDTADNQDAYVTTWVQQVEHMYPGPDRTFVTPQPEQFDRMLPDEDDRFSEIAQDVCTFKPGVIFFAGRPKDLEQFVGALGGRQCATPITVISGDDDIIEPGTGTTGQYRDFKEALGLHHVSLFSTALAHLDEWTRCGPVPQSQGGASEVFAGFKQEFLQLFGPHAAQSLQSGDAILSRDAVAIAIHTIRLGRHQPKISRGQWSYNYQAVTQELSDLTDAPFLGASGVITLSGLGASKGDPIGKPLAIVRHEPDGTVRCRRVEVPQG
jgi:hypothetical protein